MSTPLRVLFVCTANICRSPYMELLSRAWLDHADQDEVGEIVVASAGTHGFEGKQMNRTMAGTLVEGIAHREFVSRRLHRALVDEADLVLTADGTHRQFVLEEYPAAFRKVFTLGQFAEVVRRAPGVVGRDLVVAAAGMNGISQVQADVPDPYGRGPEAAAACAHQIDQFLDVVLPALAGMHHQVD